jgi:hypothetical protein
MNFSHPFLMIERQGVHPSDAYYIQVRVDISVRTMAGAILSSNVTGERIGILRLIPAMTHRGVSFLHPPITRC